MLIFKFLKLYYGTIVVIDKHTSDSYDEDSDSTIQEIENQFNKLSFNKLNSISLTKNWYSKPTPPDLQFEERNLSNQFFVLSSKMYEWNIDGLSEQELLNKLNHMSMDNGS